MRLFISMILLTSLPILSEEWKKGSEFPFKELEDQSETIQIIPEDTKKVFFIADMPASKIINASLEEKESNFLPDKKAILISDIHRMPGLITRFVALPKMRGYTYKIYLIRDDETGKDIPKEKEKITYFKLKKGIITSIQFLETRQDFEKALEER
jgi:hypothetical protein